MSNTRIRKVQNEREFETVIDEYITQGYKIKSRGEKTANLQNMRYGSLISHVLIAIVSCWLLFIPNLIWFAYNYTQNSDSVLIKIVEE